MTLGAYPRAWTCVFLLATAGTGRARAQDGATPGNATNPALPAPPAEPVVRAPAPLGTPADPVGSSSSPASAPADAEAAAEACRAFDLDACVRLNEALLEREDLPSAQRAEAYQRLASAYAAMEDVARSAAYWRLLLRLQPDMDLPADTSPKILVVFRSVQLEEHMLADQLERESWRRTVESITLVPSLPLEHRGGMPLRVQAYLGDPRHAVDQVTLYLRLGESGPFSSLPMTCGAEMNCIAEIPGALTAGKVRRPLFLYFELVDASQRVLVQQPRPEVAHVVRVLPGEVPAPPPWQQPVFLRVIIAAAVAGGVVATTLLVGGAAMLGVAVAVWISVFRPVPPWVPPVGAQALSAVPPSSR